MKKSLCMDARSALGAMRLSLSFALMAGQSISALHFLR
jgi:hypothetical protein